MTNTLDPLIFSPEAVIGPGKTALIAARPNAAQFVDTGRYSELFVGWRAQAARLILRIADEVDAVQLSTSGDKLRELAASEFETVLPPDPVQSIGFVSLARSTGTLPAGVIPKGFRWKRPADPTSQFVPKPQIDIETVQDTVVLQNQTSASVPIRAISAGSAGNTPWGPGAAGTAIGSNDIVAADPSLLFDQNLSPSSSSLAGGSDGPVDADIRRAAKAYYLGKYGPTLGAIVAGVLLLGAGHPAVLEVPAIAATVVFAADISWASSGLWQNALTQNLRDNYQGFGCRVNVVQAGQNIFIQVAATVTLRRADYLNDTTAITSAIQAAVRRYFDDRPDWYQWNQAALRGVISRADRKILKCTAVAVTDAVTGAPYTASTFNPLTGSYGLSNPPYHYYLSNNGVICTYLAPT